MRIVGKRSGRKILPDIPQPVRGHAILARHWRWNRNKTKGGGQHLHRVVQRRVACLEYHHEKRTDPFPAAEIRSAKVARRMYQSGEITVRDAYDLAAASIHDSAALSQACGHASPRALSTVSAIVEALPGGWSANDTKALAAPKHRWSERELQERLLAALKVDPARHVRSRPVRRAAIVRFLNQFAVAG